MEQLMSSPPPIRWFYWGDTVAVVRGYEAFSVGASGWRPVNEADVTWDGRPLSEAAARSVFSMEFEAFGEPPVTAP
jgi:hypothetical protein